MKKCIKVAIFGCGNRGNFYGSYAKEKPNYMKVVQVVDSNKTALEYAKNYYGLNDEDCFLSFEEWLKAPKKADAILNCFMDKYHIETTMPLFKMGYDVLLEKPICNNPEELIALMDESKKYNKTLMVCHVLRYTPFYSRIKKIIDSKELGDIVTIEMAEHVYLPHMMSSYVRGKWRSESECGSPMIMAKCCHDTDLMCFFNSDAKPVYVTCFGERTQFVPSRKPKDATDKCLTCPHMKTCQYSCYWYLENKAQDPIVFNNAVEGKRWDEVTIEDKKKVFMESDSLGKCAFDGPQDLVDHQTTAVDFSNGVTATLTMVGGASYPCRTIHIILTKGELYGMFESNKLHVMKYDMTKFSRTTKTLYLGNVGIGHGGGDMRLIADFIEYLRTGKKSISQTRIENSIDGHLLGIGADLSDKTRKTVKITDDRNLEVLK